MFYKFYEMYNKKEYWNVRMESIKCGMCLKKKKSKFRFSVEQLPLSHNSLSLSLFSRLFYY